MDGSSNLGDHGFDAGPCGTESGSPNRGENGFDTGSFGRGAERGFSNFGNHEVDANSFVRGTESIDPYARPVILVEEMQSPRSALQLLKQKHPRTKRFHLKTASKLLHLIERCD